MSQVSRVRAAAALGALAAFATFSAASRADEPRAPDAPVPAGAPVPASAPPAPPVGPAGAEVKYEVAGSSLRVLPAVPGLPPREVPLGCEGRGLLKVASKLYVACGAAGVVRLDLRDPATPTVEGRTPVDGEAVSVFLLGQRPWVEIARTEARPLDTTFVSAPLPAHAHVVAPAVEGAPEGPPSGPPRPVESRVAPPRVGDVWDLSTATHLFLPFGTIGFGALGEAELVKRFDIPLSIHASAKPIGGAGGKQGGVGTAMGLGVVALDTQFLELGLGVGAATINSTSSSSSGTSSESSSVVVAQLARIGSRDGLSFDARTTIVVRRDNFQFGTFDGSMQIPLAARWHLVTGGGGGIVGYAYGHAGARYRLSDTTKEGAFAITGSAGVAGIFGHGTCNTVAATPNYSYTQCTERSYVGPALRIGLEWRL